MAEYSLSEFRANTRKAFDEADRGEPVYIERYGKDFILMTTEEWNNTMAAKLIDEKFENSKTIHIPFTGKKDGRKSN